MSTSVERFVAQVRVEDLGGGRSRLHIVPEMADPETSKQVA